MPSREVIAGKVFCVDELEFREPFRALKSSLKRPTMNEADVPVCSLRIIRVRGFFSGQVRLYLEEPQLGLPVCVCAPMLPHTRLTTDFFGMNYRNRVRVA